MRLKLKLDEATKRYYLHLIVVHAKWNQTKHIEISIDDVRTQTQHDARHVGAPPWA